MNVLKTATMIKKINKKKLLLTTLLLVISGYLLSIIISAISISLKTYVYIDDQGKLQNSSNCLSMKNNAKYCKVNNNYIEVKDFIMY